MKHIAALTRQGIVSAEGRPTSGMMDINGRKLYVETYGNIERPAIAFLHGGPGTSCVEQREMASLLGERYFIVSFDQFGVFRSEAPQEGERFGMREHIDQLEELRKALGLRSWSLLGHSYGGMLVCYYTYYYPRSIDVAMYENPSWCFYDDVKYLAQMYIDLYFDDHPDEKEGLAAAQYILNKDYSGHEDEAMWDILKAQSYVKDKRVTMYMHSIEPDAYFNTFEDCFRELEMTDEDKAEMDRKELAHLNALNSAGEINENHRAKIAAIQNPSLLLVGQYDPVCPETEREFFRHSALNGEVVVLPNSAHHPRLENKEMYKDAVFAFMKRHVG